MEGLLLIGAWILKVCFGALLFIWGVIVASCRWELRKYLKQVAIMLDVWGNVVGQHTFNHILIKKDDYPFGSRHHTISYVMAVNKEKNNLTRFGRFIEWILNCFEKDHLQKSIPQNQNP